MSEEVQEPLFEPFFTTRRKLLILTEQGTIIHLALSESRAAKKGDNHGTRSRSIATGVVIETSGRSAIVETLATEIDAALQYAWKTEDTHTEERFEAVAKPEIELSRPGRQIEDEGSARAVWENGVAARIRFLTSNPPHSGIRRRSNAQNSYRIAVCVFSDGTPKAACRVVKASIWL
jgi:hypothetical protein